MGNWKKIKNEILKDQEVRDIYEGLEVEYQIICDMISLRNKKKMTQKELASKIKTSQSALSRFESGQIKNPSLDFLKKIAKGLDVKLSVRFGL